MIASFQRELKPESMKAIRAELVDISGAPLKNRGFCSDMRPSHRADINYGPTGFWE